MAETWIPIVMFLTTGFVLGLWIISRHKEREMLIEKGFAGDDIKSLYARTHNPYGAAKWAMIFLFGGTGLLVGTIIEEYMRNDAYVFASVIIFTGAGLLTYQKFYGDKMAKFIEDEENKN